MARAKSHYISKQMWHITHRCHKREFILKFAMDRLRETWVQTEGAQIYSRYGGNMTGDGKLGSALSEGYDLFWDTSEFVQKYVEETGGRPN